MGKFLIINFKAYEQGTGGKALEIAKIADKVAKEYSASIIIAVQHTDIRLIASSVDIPVFAQHIDPVTYGSHTGWILPESVKDAGAEGTLLNHSEHHMGISDLEKSINIAKKLKLKTLACAQDPEMAKALSVFNPYWIAVEPLELISGDISISKAEPFIITQTIDLVKHLNPSIPVLVGAGVKTGADVLTATELGADGILIASGVMKSENPEDEIRSLAEGLQGV